MCHKRIWSFRRQFLVSAESGISTPPSACTISTECSCHLNGSSLIAKYRVIILSDTVTSHLPSARLTYSSHTGLSPRCMGRGCRSSSVKCNHYKLLSGCRKTYAFLQEEWPTAHSSMRDLKCANCWRIVSTKLLSPFRKI